MPTKCMLIYRNGRSWILMQGNTGLKSSSPLRATGFKVSGCIQEFGGPDVQEAQDAKIQGKNVPPVPSLATGQGPLMKSKGHQEAPKSDRFSKEAVATAMRPSSTMDQMQCPVSKSKAKTFQIPCQREPGPRQSWTEQVPSSSPEEACTKAVTLGKRDASRDDEKPDIAGALGNTSHILTSVPLSVIDDCPPLPAPFEHRIVNARQLPVGSYYTVNSAVLGGGRFGRVHKCAERSSGLMLAAKFIKVQGAKHRDEVKNEIGVMNQLNHINLVKLYDAFESRNNLTLIMEYLDGGELFDRITDERYQLTEMDAIVFTRQICEGVQYLHQQYILHLDLKPENIVCVNNTGNQIKIIDFGLARKYRPREKLRVNFGTPEFLAPEIVRYEFVSFPTDMWSVGVITYMLLSGLSPFLGESDTETMNNIISSAWNFDDEVFKDVSVEAKDFVSQLLVPQTCGRMSAAASTRHSWIGSLEKKASMLRACLKSQLHLQRYLVARRQWKDPMKLLTSLKVSLTAAPPAATQKHFLVVTAANRLKSFCQTKPEGPT